MEYAEPREISDMPTIERIAQFRVDVWRDEGVLSDDAWPEGAWLDEYDDYSHHWASMNGDVIVASARMSFHTELSDVPDFGHIEHLNLSLPTPIASFNRMVVHKTARRRGLGGKLMEHRIRGAAATNAKVAIMQATDTAVRRAEKLGFKSLGCALSPIEAPNLNLTVMMGVVSELVGNLEEETKVVFRES